METEQNVSSSSARFEWLSFNTLLVTLILGVVAFAPVSFLSLAVVKTLVIGVGTAIAVIFFILSRIKAKSFSISLHPLVWIAAATALSVLLSSLFSPSIVSSFFGKSFSADTAVFLLVLFVSGALSFALTKGSVNRTFLVFSSVLGSFSLLAIFHIIRFFLGANFLSLGVFTNIVYTAIGSWHDLGIFAGLALILSLITLQLLPITNKLARALFIASFVLAAVILVVVDFTSIWILVAIATLAFAIYRYITARKTSGIPVFAIIVAVIAIVLAWSPGPIGNVINTDIIAKTGASYSEVNLPWDLTFNIAESTIKTSPIFGAGPARFVNQYLKYKPEVINATPFWASDFSNGNSFVLTNLTTEGILGFALWIILIVAFLWIGANALLRNGNGESNESGSPFMKYGLAASYFGTGFLILSLFSYVPGHAILLSLFILAGVFAAHVIASPGKTINFSAGSLKIPSIVILWILIVASAVVAVFYVKNTIAEVYFQGAVRTLNNGGTLSSGAQDIQTALKLNKSDFYYQAVSQLDLLAVNQIVSAATSTPSQSTIQLIGGLINDGINSARLAEQFDKTNPYNYLAEGQVAAVATQIGIPDAYGLATSSYQTALTLDPLDPSIYLALTKLQLIAKDEASAKNDLNVALQIKPDYVDAIFEAGVISYQDKDYATALTAFTQVQKLQSNYPNIQADIDAVKSVQSGTPVVTNSPTSSASTVSGSTTSTTSATAGTTTTKKTVTKKR